MEPMDAAQRARFMLDGIDVAASKGIEIGPLASPVVTRGQGDIRYLDHVDVASLQSTHGVHHAVDESRIVALDYVLDGRSIRETVGNDGPFDYVVASHVIEHVPDPITWLRDIRSVLSDGGAVSLAVPDGRRGFDIHRDPTTVADLIDAHLHRAAVPSPGQIYDHLSSAKSYHGEVVWGDDPPLDELVNVHTPAEALACATAAAGTGEYVDVHCWVFTPTSFAFVITELGRLQLHDFAIERCTDTVVGEFFATLRAGPTPIDVAAQPPPSRTELERRLAATELELWHASRDRDLLRAQLDRTYATASWRITAPLRAATDWFRRRGR